MARLGAIAGRLREAVRSGWAAGTVVLWAALVVGWASLPQALYGRYINGEHGFVENTTVLLLLGATFYAAASARLLALRGLRFVAVVLGLYAFGCAAIAGEELNWGQIWFGWHTPPFFDRYNLQHETNLHNLSTSALKAFSYGTWLAIALGGFGLPLALRILRVDSRPARHWLFWLVPAPPAMLPAGLVVATVLLVRTLYVIGAPERPKLGSSLLETVELLTALYLLVYALSLFTRLRQSAISN